MKLSSAMLRGVPPRRWKSRQLRPSSQPICSPHLLKWGICRWTRRKEYLHTKAPSATRETSSRQTRCTTTVQCRWRSAAAAIRTNSLYLRHVYVSVASPWMISISLGLFNPQLIITKPRWPPPTPWRLIRKTSWSITRIPKRAISTPSTLTW